VSPIVLAAVAGLASPARALDPQKGLAECTVETFGIGDGLTGAPVRAISQTPDGYLWIGTYGAVERYDGARIVRLETPSGLDVVGLLPTPDGGLLVTAKNGDPLCARAGLLAACPGAVPRLPVDTRLLVLHRDRDGALWLGTDQGLFNVAGERVTVHHPATALRFGEITGLHRDARGRVWVAATNGLFVSDGGGFVPWKGPDGVLPPPARSIFAAPGGHLWVATDRLLLRIEGDRIETWRQPEAGGWRSVVIEDRDGNVWIGTQGGLLRFREGHFLAFNRRDGLPDEHVMALFEDREGALWVGTRSGMVAQFTDRTVRTNAGPPSLRRESIESIVEDRGGTLWFATWRGLTSWKDGRERTFTRADGLPGDHVYSLSPGAGDELWVAAESGLVRWRGDRLEPPVWPLPYPTRLVSVHRDERGTVWAGTDHGLLRLEADGLRPVPVEDGFTPEQVRGFAEDDAGVLWVTTQGGLARVSDGRLVRGAPGTDVGKADRGLFRDADRTLWFGAGSDLIRRRRGAFHAFPGAQGVARDAIFQVLADDRGFLWMATNHALVRIAKQSLEEPDVGGRPRQDPVSLEISDQRAEIAGRRSRTPGAWKARDGRLWFATLNGAVTIDPARVRTNTVPPTVVIEKATVDGRPAAADKVNVFPPGLGNLELNFAGVTLVEPRRARHRYRLEGFDEDWVDAGVRRSAQYTNLPPGRYRFRVQASNADGVWNEAGATLDLQLLPHFYETPAFYGLCALGVAALAFSAYRMRLRRLRAQYLAVFAERTRVARELHDSLLQGMTAAALLLDHVRSELPASATTAAQRLGVVQDAVKASLEEARRVVWNLREQQGGTDDLGLALSRLAARLADGAPVRCDVRVEGRATPLSHDVQGSVFRIAQEALTNAVKHAEARQIEVRLRYGQDAVGVSVSDDGRGFEPDRLDAARAGHFGLVGMRERASRVGAALTIDSRPGQGTRVDLSVPRNGARHGHA
jgi:signal transduction histidine kinase/ligand-binding sensor domain-containing protein